VFGVVKGEKKRQKAGDDGVVIRQIGDFGG
jgi:hypothetical protein